jgi:hypothetical protein
LLWTSSRKEERTWENKVGLIGLFEVEWKIPCHNILVEFSNNWKLDFEHKKSKHVKRRVENYRQTSFGKGFLNLPYKRDKGIPSKNVRCQSSTGKHN